MSRTNINTRTLFLGTLSLLIFLHTVMAYGLRVRHVAIALFLFFLLTVFAGVARSLLLSGSLCLATFLMAALVSLSGVHKNIYFRPDEILRYYDFDLMMTRFVPNRELRKDMPYGDLRNLKKKITVAVPRSVLYKTDAIGFRNNQGYAKEKFILVGDSFVVGSGSDQTEMISEQLRDRYGLSVYNAAHPGPFPLYESNVKLFNSVYGDQGRFFLFLFEGNDFPEIMKPWPAIPTSGWGRLKNRLEKYIHSYNALPFYRVMKNFRWQLNFLGKDLDRLVFVKQTALGEMAFFSEYAGVSQQKTYAVPAHYRKALTEMAPQIEAVFFIPTKYRVYNEVFGFEEDPLPNAVWNEFEKLCQELDLSCLNLTAPLVARSQELADTGEVTFYRDDTHWNAHGMALVADQIHAHLN